MSAIINRATLREELQSQNRALESVKASIQPLRTAIDSYVSDSDLQGSGVSAHKNYLTEGHIPTLDELTKGIDALMNANSSNMAAIDTHLQSDSYDQQQIENELSSLNRQINSWWFPLYESINRQGARTLRNRRTNVQNKQTRLQNYLSATNHLYDGMEDIWMAAERNLVRIENKTVCPQTGEFILLPAEMVDEIILESLLSGELGLPDAAWSALFAGASAGLGLVASNAHRTSVELYRSTLLSPSGLPIPIINHATISAAGDALRRSAMNNFVFETVTTVTFNVISELTTFAHLDNTAREEPHFENVSLCE